MLLLMQDIILLEGPFYILPSEGALSKIFFRASRHVVYVACIQVMVVYEIVAHYFIIIFIG